MAEKHFEATPSRLARAKREGDVASSHELSSVAAFAFGLGGTAAILPAAASAAKRLLIGSASGRPAAAAGAVLLAAMCVPAVCAACGAALCGIAQASGLRFTALKCDLRRLAPTENLRRMFSREAAVTAARASLAFASAAGAIGAASSAIAASALHAGGLPALAAAARDGAMRSAWAACAAGALFACVDYALQTARRRKRLRMSFEELKRDHKEQEGDPLARGRRRAFHRAIAKGSLQRVKDAAFVVANPTHIAVAIEYRPPQEPVPRVLACAADESALRVRAYASEHGIPVIENVPLARQLYACAKPGEYIPHETYLAVAEVVAALVKSGALA
ncbi:MAG: EscU/YscU/HrcU family type III secretion system export apparatus switch protein [Candidatus Baltobacteraceae bacterium]